MVSPTLIEPEHRKGLGAHTAGLALLCVRGKSLVPAPPPRISDTTVRASTRGFSVVGDSCNSTYFVIGNKTKFILSFSKIQRGGSHDCYRSHLHASTFLNAYLGACIHLDFPVTLLIILTLKLAIFYV